MNISENKKKKIFHLSMELRKWFNSLNEYDKNSYKEYCFKLFEFVKKDMEEYFDEYDVPLVLWQQMHGDMNQYKFSFGVPNKQDKMICFYHIDKNKKITKIIPLEPKEWS